MSLSTCLRLENGQFVPAVDPLDRNLDEATSLTRAGYFKQFPAEVVSAVTIYQHIDGVGMPKYLVSVWGVESEMALLVADDFNHLIATMEKIDVLTKCARTYSH
jgi:hypothetical protein